jgi:hypothetical protein
VFARPLVLQLSAFIFACGFTFFYGAESADGVGDDLVLLLLPVLRVTPLLVPLALLALLPLFSL